MPTEPGDWADPATLPLERQSTTARVTEHIRWMIFRGQLRPGDKVPQDDIARTMAVSRLPVREALQELERDGLVRTRPHVGTFIAEFDERVITDHFKIVGLIQGLAAELVLESADEKVLTALRRVGEHMKTLTDPHEVNDAAIEFQRVVNSGADSPRLRAVLRALGRLMPHGIMGDALASVDGAAEEEVKATEEMLFALQIGSAAAVREAAARSNRRRAEVLIATLRNTGALPSI